MNYGLVSMRSDLATFFSSIFGRAKFFGVRLADAINLCKGANIPRNTNEGTIIYSVMTQISKLYNDDL